MAPRTHSRHLFTAASRRPSEDGDASPLFLSDRVPFRYRDLPDNRVIVVKEGDSLHRIAARTYQPLGQLPAISAANLWWVIADFQPIPIHDPTIQLVPGEKLVIPSLRVVMEQILQRPRNV